MELRENPAEKLSRLRHARDLSQDVSATPMQHSMILGDTLTNGLRTLAIAFFACLVCAFAQAARFIRCA